MDQLLIYSNNPVFKTFASLVALIVLSLIAAFILRKYLLRVLNLIANRISGWLSEIILDQCVLNQLTWLAPLFVLHQGLGFIPNLPVDVVSFLKKGISVGLIVVFVRTIHVLTSKGHEVYGRLPVSRDRPIKGYLQVVIIFNYIVGLVLFISIISDRSPFVFLSGIGAMMAVILLVFRDTLLSLVAGIQLTTNNVIKVGDWIEMPQFNADGDVIDIALHVVQVQNWDKTVSVIPTHKFLEHSFRNWRGMEESGGRRIKRSILIDINTVRFLDNAEIDKFGNHLLLEEYIKNKKIEIEAWKKAQGLPTGEEKIPHSRRLTNLGTFRAYLVSYLKQLPSIHKDMTFLVRQLQPGPTGVPLEIYVFSNDIAWANYENIQSDIFDHIMAIAPEFGLEIYQSPGSKDLRSLSENFVELQDRP